jgi:hypothetical protein
MSSSSSSKGKSSRSFSPAKPKSQKPQEQRISTMSEPKGRPESATRIITRRGSIRGTRLG